MLTYRVTTNGRQFRVEMFDPCNLRQEWLPISGLYSTRELAEKRMRSDVDEQAWAAAHPWVPVETGAPPV